MADDTEDHPIDEEAAIEAAWRASGSLHLIAMRLAECRMRNEPPPAWVVAALFKLADASVDIQPSAKIIRLVRYVAVREAHYQERLPWGDKVKERAAEMLRGTPSEAGGEMIMKDYNRVRKVLREAGCVRDDDDPGYRWIDLSNKAPG